MPRLCRHASVYEILVRISDDIEVLSESLMILFAQGDLDEDEEGAVEDDEQLVADVQAELTGLCV